MAHHFSMVKLTLKNLLSVLLNSDAQEWRSVISKKMIGQGVAMFG